MRRYTRDAPLTIDNNASERAMRTPAVGRNNWLFLGSRDAGPRAAVLYTILAGAKRHHLEPWAYVHDALRRAAQKNTNWEDVLPERWAAQHPESVLSDRLEEARSRAKRKRERRQRRRDQQMVG